MSKGSVAIICATILSLAIMHFKEDGAIIVALLLYLGGFIID